MVNYNTIKGFKDFIGSEANKRKEIKKVIEEEFELYGFEIAETPIIEREEFVKGENNNDEAVRDVFKLKDRGKRELALRYEFTFQLPRIAKNQKLPYKRYQIGYCFRDEPIRKGRLRQFIQCDADIIGSNINDEAEILSLAKNVFEKLKIPIKIYINSRKLINEILVSENIKEKNRKQIIREIDKLDKKTTKEVADKLKELNCEKLIKIFTQKEEYFKKYKFYEEIKELKKTCKNYGIKTEFRPYLARGLGYYNGNIFEIWNEELKASLAGGGSYLVEQTQATGITLGLEPIMLLAKINEEKTKVQITSIGYEKEAIEITKKLREKKITTNLILNKTIKKSLEYANNKKTPYVIIIGKKEIEEGKYTIKEMKKGTEEKLTEKEIIKKLS